MTPCPPHRWSPWRVIDRGLLERRCPCGNLEWATPEAIHTGTLAGLDAALDDLMSVIASLRPRGATR